MADKNDTSHDAYLGIVESAPFGIYMVDSDFKLIRISEGAQRVFSRIHEPIGRDFGEVLSVLWQEPFLSDALARFRHTLATGEDHQAPRTVQERADTGEVEAYDWRLRRVLLPDGRWAVVCYFYDMTERQREQDELRRAQERYQAFMRHSAEGIWRCEVEHPMSVELPVDAMLDFAYAHAYLAECNDAMARMYGYEDETCLVGTRLADLVPRTPENEALLRHFFTNGFRATGGESVERHRNGHEVHFSNNLVGIVENGFLMRVWGTQSDISQRKCAEAALRRTNAELERFNTVAVGRELRMVELKREINGLCHALGLPDRFPTESDRPSHG